MNNINNTNKNHSRSLRRSIGGHKCLVVQDIAKVCLNVQHIFKPVTDKRAIKEQMTGRFFLRPVEITHIERKTKPLMARFSLVGILL